MTHPDGATSAGPLSFFGRLTKPTRPNQARQTPLKSKPPPFLEFRSSTVFIVAVVCLAVFTDILFYGLIVPVIPFSLSAQAGVPEDQVQHWTAILLACYNAALFAGSPIAGFYADHTSSRRWPFLLGLIALCASTLLLCLGRNVAVLAVGRILQGLSAAIVWSVGLALLVDTVGRDIGYAMGYVNIAMSVGLLISPVIGGAVYAAAGYYAVYYIAFAVIFCDIALRLVMVEKRVARQWLGDDGSGIRRGTSAGVTREQLGQDQASDSARALDEKGMKAGNGPAASPSPTRASDGSDAALSGAARHPHRELIRNRRILAVLLGVAIEAAIV
jgi:MFS family permease